jgi:hypothetical protein
VTAAIVGDAAEEETARATFQLAVERFGGGEILVNHDGRTLKELITETSGEEVQVAGQRRSRHGQGRGEIARCGLWVTQGTTAFGARLGGAGRESKVSPFSRPTPSEHSIWGGVARVN